MNITVKSLGENVFRPKMIYVANGWLFNANENGEITSTEDVKQAKIYSTKEELEKDVSILIREEDIFTVVPKFAVDDGMVVDIHYEEDEEYEVNLN